MCLGLCSNSIASFIALIVLRSNYILARRERNRKGKSCWKNWRNCFSCRAPNTTYMYNLFSRISTCRFSEIERSLGMFFSHSFSPSSCSVLFLGVPLQLVRSCKHNGKETESIPLNAWLGRTQTHTHTHTHMKWDRSWRSERFSLLVIIIIRWS